MNWLPPKLGPILTDWDDKSRSYLIVLLTFIFWSPALTGAFAWDDTNNLVDNHRLQAWSAIIDSFRNDAMWSANMKVAVIGTYRPISLASLVIDYKIFGAGPVGYHLTSILWHCLASVLVFRLLRRFITPGIALAAVALWTVHPVDSEAVAWINGRSEIFALIFGSGAALLLTAAQVGWVRVLGAAVCLLGAMLGKESGVIFLPVAVLLATEARHRRAGDDRLWLASLDWRGILAGVLGLAAYLYIRSKVFEGNPLPGAADKLDMFPSAAAVLLRCVQSALVPLDISVTYLYLWYNHLTDTDRIVGWVVLAVIGGLLGFAWTRRNRIAVLCFAWWAFSVTPVLVLVARDWPGLARWLYMGGPGLFAGLAIVSSGPRVVRLGKELGVAFGLFCAVQTQRSIQVWHDSRTLYEQMVVESPDEPFGFLGLAWLYLRIEYYEGCEKMARRGIELGTRGHDIRSFLVAALAGQNKCDEARTEIYTPEPIADRQPWMLYATANCFAKAERWADAKPLFDECADRDVACKDMSKTTATKLGPSAASGAASEAAPSAGDAASEPDGGDSAP